ncbi:phage portal protein [Polaromonas sp.]|uniref:phage portal protein n=1 Tax=Polaromonas sp. TaxID=1869339 RepID=UPI0037503C49
MSIFSRIAAVFTGQREESRLQNVTYGESIQEAFGVKPGAAGMTVSATTAQRVSAVAACRQKIAGSISTLRLDILQINGDTEVKLPRDALWYLLNEAPHTQYTATSHWENKVSEQLLRGDGFTWIRRRMNGSIAEMFPLPWGSVQPWRMSDGSVRYYISLPEFGITTWLDPADILHFPGSGFDGLRSMSVIAYGAKNAIGNALAMDDYSGKFFANGAHPSMVIEAPAKMDSPQVTQLQESFARKYAGNENAHRLPLVLTQGLKAKEISLSADDAQLLEARKFQVVDIARAFGVPPHMIGETSGSSAVGAGYEQQARDFVMHTLRLHLKRLEQELNRKLFPRDTGKFVRFDLGDLIEGDSKAQAEYNRAALGGPGTGPGWMSVNEVRKSKGLPPAPDGDKLFVPVDPAKKASNENSPAT